MPALTEPEKATSGDDVTCYDGGAMKSAQAEAKRLEAEPKEEKKAVGKADWKKGMKSIQINLKPDDELFLRLNPVAELYGVSLSLVAEWKLRGLSFDCPQPEQAEAEA